MSSQKNSKTKPIELLDKIKELFQHTTSFFYLSWNVLKLIGVGFIKPRKVFKPGLTATHMFEMGICSLPIVGVTSLFLGMTLAMLVTYALAQFGTEVWVASMVGVGFTRELGPLITAIVVAGRVGASISAELGTMRVSEEIDALETMGINPIRYLIIPRVLALLIMLPCLTVLSDYLGILGGYLVAHFKLGMSFAYYRELTINALLTKDIITGLIKSVSFAMIISMMGCYQGIIVQGGAEGVGKGTTKAVVNSLIFVIASDTFFTALFSYVIT